MEEMIDKIGESKIEDMIEEEVADHMDGLDEKIRSIVLIKPLRFPLRFCSFAISAEYLSK